MHPWSRTALYLSEPCCRLRKSWRYTSLKNTASQSCNSSHLLQEPIYLQITCRLYLRLGLYTVLPWLLARFALYKYHIHTFPLPSSADVCPFISSPASVSSFYCLLLHCLSPLLSFTCLVLSASLLKVPVQHLFYVSLSLLPPCSSALCSPIIANVFSTFYFSSSYFQLCNVSHHYRFASVTSLISLSLLLFMIRPFPLHYLFLISFTFFTFSIHSILKHFYSVTPKHKCSTVTPTLSFTKSILLQLAVSHLLHWNSDISIFDSCFPTSSKVTFFLRISS